MVESRMREAVERIARLCRLRYQLGAGLIFCFDHIRLISVFIICPARS